MDYIAINKLKPHPQNNYFFDDVVGEKWTEFLDSIRLVGIKEPLIITQDFTIVSGHQRLRAAKKLKLKEVPYIQYDYATEDDVLRDLIELNIRQRGVMSDSETKQGRRFKELKRIYNIRNGGNRKSVEQNVQLKTATQLADEYGTTQQQMNRTIQVANSDPRLQEWNISGKTSGDAIRYIMSNMTPDEIDEFIKENEYVKKIRKADAEKYLSKKQTQIATIEPESSNSQTQDLESKIKELEAENARLKKIANVLRPDSDSDKAVEASDELVDTYLETKHFFEDKLLKIEYANSAYQIRNINVVAENYRKLADLAADFSSRIYKMLDTNETIIDI